MQKALNSEAVKTALATQGITQTQLAKSVGVSSQAVTNWLKGKDFPRPAALLKLATILRLTFDQMVETESANRPIVAFRKKGSAKTTATHIAKATELGMLLKPLVPYLTGLRTLRTLIASPSVDYNKLQMAVTETRAHLGIGEKAVLDYEHLIGEFKNCGAVLVPVLWGAKGNHENALHIRLPQEDVTFIFLNLDTRLEDFKFWMAHELAHVYTPKLTGENEGEDYADAFAGALLFPQACAESAYYEAIRQTRPIQVLQNYANEYMISLNTVYQEVIKLIKSVELPPLPIIEKNIHAMRNSNPGALVSKALFDPMPPSPQHYIAACENIFQSNFFYALKSMIHDKHTGPSYIQQLLDTAIRDAHALYEELYN